MGATSTRAIDPITFEVVRNALVNIVDEMGVRLSRAAFSPVVSEGRDFSLCLAAPDGDIVCAGPEDLPAALGTLGFTVGTVLDRFADEVAPGDVFLVNDPHRAGSHMNDMRVVYPVFVDGELFAWLIGFGHWTDVGGPEPGSFNAYATSCFAEGLRVPPIRIHQDGRPIDSALDLIFGNMRLPHEARGDLQAVLEACRAGDGRLNELAGRYGAAVVQDVAREMMDHSERLLLANVQALPEGVYEFTDWVDVDLPHPDQPSYSVTLRLKVADGQLTFDYTASDPAPVGPSGSPLPMTWSATICGLLNVFPDVPFNQGVLRAIEVLTVPGSCVHVEYPGAICGTGAGTYEKMLTCVLRCFGLADSALASGGIYNLTNVTVGGVKPSGAAWVMYVWQPGGFGATQRGDGGPPMMSLFSAGTRNQPIEVIERAYPVLFDSVAMVPDSMGAGRYRGGPAEERVFTLLGESEGTVGAIGDRHVFPILGVDGGAAGGKQDVFMDWATDASRSLGVNFSGEQLRPGHRVRIVSGGGGGLGDPTDRPIDEVMADVADGLVTVAAAAEQYGVVIDASGAADAAATERRREQMRAARPDAGQS
ncbi:MAG TPA: hydantoinase B/oxoprolinase family protein [Capillimicrobium sp.]|nr:hydantoinase B/oxoprolinase family protein [Capillimicrobium sp.]